MGHVRLIALCWAVAACAERPGALRFEARAPHWRVADDRPVPKPREQPDHFHVFHYDNKIERPLAWVLGVPQPTPALDVNSLGEVADSSWFTNRIGVRDVSLEELGACGDIAPQPPWRIRKLKWDREGFTAEDATGRQWLVKLDPPAWPELGTGADIVSQRLLRAVGYNVPDDCIVHLTLDEIELADDATVTVAGQRRPLGREEIEAMLSPQPHDRRGRVRAVASLMLPGEPLGTFADAGTRADDDNDRVPHEHRRVLRGLYVFAAWLSHSDLNPGNRLDMWVEDPRGSGRGHVVHYLIDFDRTLGAMALVARTDWDSYSHSIDHGHIAASLLSFGLWRRPWEGLPRPELPGVGRFDADHFTAEGFHPRVYFMPFHYRDDLDGFWAAKLLMGLRPTHIRAAVDAAEYSDPRSAAYLTETLIFRQRILARHFFRAINPLDDFRVTERAGRATLCARDLLVAHRLDDVAAATRYEAIVYDGHGRRLPGIRTTAPDHAGELCLDALPVGYGAERYTIVSIRTWRGTRAHRPVFVHLADVPGSDALRVIGIDRRPGPARSRVRGRS